MIAYRAQDDNLDYYVIINADNQERTLTFDDDSMASLQVADVLVDQAAAGIEAIVDTDGFEISSNALTVEPLTGLVCKVNTEDEENPETDLPVSDDSEDDKNLPSTGKSNPIYPYVIVVTGIGLLFIGKMISKRRKVNNH